MAEILNGERMGTICAVCGQDEWVKLPFFSSDQSVTTSGIIVHSPLGKAQCIHCGLVQRVGQKYLALSDFYEKSYHTYFNRPGAEAFERRRYQSMASWMAGAISPFIPDTIIDVGCGSGWTMREMAIFFPHADFTGVEPSVEDAAACIKNGMKVINNTIEGAKESLIQYDLVYSNNVIQHSVSPREFLNNLKELVTDKGLILITCPDTSIPSNEIMWSDQNFSLAPCHLMKIAVEAGLNVVELNSEAGVASIANKQLIVLTKSGNSIIDLEKYQSFNGHDNIKRRFEYLEGWMSLDQSLLEVVSQKKNVYNFGASMWSYLLRAYCPKYWQRVNCCIIDDFVGIFMDKSVQDINHIDFTKDDIIVLGTEPLSQNLLLDKLQLRGINVEIHTWNNIVSQ